MNQNRHTWDRQLPLTLPNGLGLGINAGQVNYVPPSPQENKMAGQNEFIDLKRKRGNIPSCVVQPSNVLPQTAQSSTNPVQLNLHDPKIKHALEQALKGIKIEPVHKGFTPQQTLPNFSQLPDPTLAHEEEAWKKIPAVTTDQPKKTFTEGPPLPLTEDGNANEFGVDLRKDTSKAFDFELNLKSDVPATKYAPGTVKYTTHNALKDMVNDLPNLHEKNTGCIVNETCAPELDCYEDEIHFVQGQCLGRGSYGVVDLCYDSKTEKPFVRKQVVKKMLRSSEIIVPSTLNHENITKFYGLIQRYSEEEEGNPTVELLLEYGGHALNKYYQYGHRLTDAQKWEVSKQGFAGLVHINRYSIVHLDIKPENICIEVRADGSVVVKLTDFGSSRLPQEPLKFVGLTPEYMAPELCQMFLQTRQKELDFGLTEEDITGKADTFAYGLVIMHLYKGYHILVKVINNGNPSYDGVDQETRRLMHMKLMAMMADKHTEFVHNLIPDECDLDMRDLLTKLTRHKHQDRFSARDALNYIEAKEQRNKMPVRPEQIKKEVYNPIQAQVPNILCSSNYLEIPGIAEDCMESESGPVKNKTKDALRMKLNPYNKGKKNNNKYVDSKAMSPQSPMNEMNDLRHGVASKQMPMTPLAEFKDLSLGQVLPETIAEEDTNSVCSMTERNAPVAQPSSETSDNVGQVLPNAQQVPGFSAVQPINQVSAGFSCIRPSVRPMETDNVVSLAGKGAQYSIAEQQPQVCFNIPPELIQRLLLKKMITKMAAKDQQAVGVQCATSMQPVFQQRRVVKMETNVQPEVINIDSSTEDGVQMVSGQMKKEKTFGNSPLPMEEEDSNGQALPKFSMFL